MLKRICLLALFLALPALAATPNVGEHAPDFTLATPEGAHVHLDALMPKAKTVLVVLRGYPGYQCPYCQRQAQDFISHAADFEKAGAQILMVYPGPPAELDDHAKAFLDKRALPENVHLVIDPDYRVTNLYGLRWDAPHETAYPSTFLVDQRGAITFRKVSREHGDRMSAADALAKLGGDAANGH